MCQGNFGPGGSPTNSYPTPLTRAPREVQGPIEKKNIIQLSKSLLIIEPFRSNNHLTIFQHQLGGKLRLKIEGGGRALQLSLVN